MSGLVSAKEEARREVESFAELLVSIEALADTDSSALSVSSNDALEQEDDDTKELMMLLGHANEGLMRKARLRACVAGLQAVTKYISAAPSH